MRDIIVGGRRIITRDQNLINRAFQEGAEKAARVERRKPGEIILKNRLEKSGFDPEAHRRLGSERR